MSIQKLSASQKVSSGTKVADTYVVPDGIKATCISFEGSAALSSLSVIRLVWDYGGGGETDLWIIQNDEPMPNDYISETTVTGDGSKKLAVVADNGAGADYYMSGFAIIEVES